MDVGLLSHIVVFRKEKAKMRRFKRGSFLVGFLLLLVFSTGLWAAEHIRILHWNDFHAQNMPKIYKRHKKTMRLGGAAVLKAYLEKYGQGKPWVVSVHAGDEFQGTPISTLSRGMSQIEMLNLMRPDVFTLGNHEFDYGRDRLASELKLLKIPVISSNIFDKRTGRLFVRPYLIKKVDGVRLGFIGVITPDLFGLTLPRNVRDLEILSPEKTVTKYMHVIRDSVDLIVVVSHMGVRRDKELAARVPGIAVIIGGHSHTVLKQPKIVNGTLICQAGAHGTYLGKLDLWVDTKRDTIVRFNEKLIPMLTDSIQPDPVVAKKVAELEKEVSKKLDVVIAQLKTNWIRGRERAESNIGDWETDAMREAAKTDVAFQNSGGMRKDLYAGPIRKRDFWEINPFGNYLVTFRVTGKELRQILETDVNGKGEFLQVSGLKFTYDSRRPVGHRVLSVWVHGKPLRDSMTYSVCTNNFLAAQMYRNFGIPPQGHPLTRIPGIDRDIFIRAAEKQKVIDNHVEGRIVDVAPKKKSKK
jgi:2',3'-cyclic-nucleotide 2'-phosphodiesterase (5'-nucleotidase family)